MKALPFFTLSLMTLAIFLTGCGEKQEEMSDIQLDEKPKKVKKESSKPAVSLPWSKNEESGDEEAQGDGDEVKRRPEDIVQDQINACKQEISDKTQELANIRAEEKQLRGSVSMDSSTSLEASPNALRRKELRKKSVEINKQIKLLQYKVEGLKVKLKRILKKQK